MNYDLDTLIFVLNRSIAVDTYGGMFKRARKNRAIVDLILYYQKDCEKEQQLIFIPRLNQLSIPE